MLSLQKGFDGHPDAVGLKGRGATNHGSTLITLITGSTKLPSD